MILLLIMISSRQRSLKQLLVSFQRKIKQNQVMRMKHEGQPEKFMDSEVELHKEISELYAISASPELYHVFVSDGGFASVLGRLYTVLFDNRMYNRKCQYLTERMNV